MATEEKAGFVSKNWLTATMGSLVFIFGTIAGSAFDKRIIELENWKNLTDVSRANRTGELRNETTKALERLEAQQSWIDYLKKEIEHLNQDIDKLHEKGCK